MASQLLPLFTLQLVVFPRTQMPLHIFEERYKQMVGEAIRDNTEFGIVLAKEDGIVNAGCTVVVEKLLKEYTEKNTLSRRDRSNASRTAGKRKGVVQTHSAMPGRNLLANDKVNKRMRGRFS